MYTERKRGEGKGSWVLALCLALPSLYEEHFRLLMHTSPERYACMYVCEFIGRAGESVEYSAKGSGRVKLS